MRLGQALTEFINEQQYRGNSDKTVEYYRDTLRHFIADTGVEEIAQFNEGCVRGWLLGHKHLSPASVATYDKALRVFARWLYRRGYTDRLQLENLPKPRNKRQPIVTFSQSDVWAMMVRASETRQPMRNKAILTWLLDTGARIGETVTLSLYDVQWADGIALVRGKSGERTIPFGRKTKLAMRRYIDQERRAIGPAVREIFLTRFGEPWGVDSASTYLRRIAVEAGVEATKEGVHTFRHTFAIEFIRNGGDAFTLQRILGHQSMEMVRRYVSLTGSDLKLSHKKFSPGDRML